MLTLDLLDVVNRLSDKITVARVISQCSVFFQAMKLNKLVRIKFRLRKLLEDEGITLTEADYEPPVEEREHGPYSVVDADDLEIPKMEYLEPEIPSDEEMALIRRSRSEERERERLHHEDDEIPSFKTRSF